MPYSGLSAMPNKGTRMPLKIQSYMGFGGSSDPVNLL